jgi:hemoglobin-like flavoprotein/DNA-binding CsgD family transcriptional regulator
MPAKDFLKPRQKERLQKALRESNSSQLREGVLIVLLINDGKTSREITEFLGCSYRSVTYWRLHADPASLESLLDQQEPENFGYVDNLESLPDQRKSGNFGYVDNLESLPDQRKSGNFGYVDNLESLPDQRKPENFLKESKKDFKLLNIKALEDSFALVRPHTTRFAYSFYNNLFINYPQIQPLFAYTKMEDQEKKLIMALVLVINNLRNLAYLETLLKNLGERHVRYGVMREYYPILGAVLLKTLESFLGTDWTPEVKQAWIDGYDAIANLMLEGDPENSIGGDA